MAVCQGQGSELYTSLNPISKLRTFWRPDVFRRKIEILSHSPKIKRGTDKPLQIKNVIRGILSEARGPKCSDEKKLSSIYYRYTYIVKSHKRKNNNAL